MRITLTAIATLLLWMCEAEPPPMPPAEHGGVVVSVGAQPLELVAHADGQIAAYPIGASTARGVETAVIVHVPGTDGVVHDATLAWDEPSAKFVGTIPVAPAVGPIEVDAVVAGAPVHASAPVFVVLAPAAPVVVGTAPATVEVVAPRGPHHVEIAAPSRPTVVVEPPRPGVVVVEPPRPGLVVVEPPRPPGVVVLAPEPPRPLVVAPPRPGVVVVGPRPPGVVVVGGGHVEEPHGHWDHGRHGGRGPEYHVGGGGGGHGHGRH